MPTFTKGMILAKSPNSLNLSLLTCKMNIKQDNAIKWLAQGSIRVALFLEAITFRIVGDIQERDGQGGFLVAIHCPHCSS